MIHVMNSSNLFRIFPVWIRELRSGTVGVTKLRGRGMGRDQVSVLTFSSTGVLEECSAKETFTTGGSTYMSSKFSAACIMCH